MPPRNTEFRFKQFVVKQENTAMKVCTDSCIFGAIVNPGDAERILDIGAGTGLLSLMLAQRSNGLIDAVELDTNAAAQSEENFKASPWGDRLRLHHSSIQSFVNEAECQYDFIVSNPPFYPQSLKSDQKDRNLAMHSDALSFEELVDCIGKLLSGHGRFSVLLPAFEADLFKLKSEAAGFSLNETITVHNHENGPVIRSINTFSRENKEVKTDSLIIRDAANEYSKGFQRLLKDYYLIF